MIYKEYGQTGKKVSAVGFGGMRFDTEKPNAENAELLLYAFDKGINYFDTAPGYCQDKSEDIFGLAMKQMADKRDEFYISTKQSPESTDTADKACKMVETSLKRLNIEKIDFCHVWCIRAMEHYEMAMKKGGQYEGLLKCKERGLIDHIAISTHLPGYQIRQILEKKEFEGVLLGINILNFPYRWDGVQAAMDMGMGVVAMNPLGGGMIPQYKDRLDFIASDGFDVVENALRFCISCPQIAVTLNGFTTKEHIDTACKAADKCKPFTDVDIEKIKASLSKDMDSLCTGCGYCIGKCSQNIPVNSYMQYYNEKPLLGKNDEEMVTEIEHHHKWGILVGRKANAEDCVECGQCEQACTQHLNIIERLGEIAKWEEKAKN